MPDTPVPPENPPAAPSLLLPELGALLQQNIDRGRQGLLRLHPRVFWLPVSENCNLKCIGCDDVVHGFRKDYLSPQEVRRLLAVGAHGASFEEIELTGGEALLHPQLSEVLDICREMHPEAALSVISNATVPVRGKYQEAYGRFDSIGLSIDGATAETFETIRLGASFGRFKANVQDLLALRKKTGRPAGLFFCFTACRLNLHELPDVIRLAAEWGVDSVYAQPMEMNIEEIRRSIGHVHLDTVDPEVRRAHLNRAVVVAEQLGIEFSPADGLYPAPALKSALPGISLAFESKVAELGVGVTRREVSDSVQAHDAVRLCHYPWTDAPAIRKTGAHWRLLLCCYMSEATNAALQARYGFAEIQNQSMLDIFNSEGYWRFREDMLAGRTASDCGNCAAARTRVPSRLTLLAYELEALAAQQGLSFPGGPGLRDDLRAGNGGGALAERALAALRQEWLVAAPSESPWLTELLERMRQLADAMVADSVNAHE